MNASNRRAPVEILESCFSAIAAQDADRLVEHYTDEYVLELPYWKPGESLVVNGRETARSYLAGLLAVQRMEIKVQTHRWIPDEQLLIAEYGSQGEFLDTGEPYENSYVGYWFFQGDLIRRTREYYNPQAPRASAIG
jgi:ketosteroid isomerase-like protein